LLLGAELAEQLLFTSARVLPSTLVDAGFEFTSPDLDGALRKELGK
jgi:NAD dependent epimerase/dehydratase family enzyme